MAYLSRVWLNPLRRKTPLFLRNPQALHAAVLGGIARQPLDERVLWRLAPDARSGQHRLELLVLTESRPSWEHLVEQAGWPGTDEPQTLVRSYQPLLDQVVRGRRFAFRVKANPVSSTRHPIAPSPSQQERLASQPRPRGVRVAHRTAAHQLAWLVDHVEGWGFMLLKDEDGRPATRLVARDRLSFRKRRPDGTPGATVVLQTATFDGILQVSDPDLARRSLLTGVGPGKAYGLGLITLAPPVPNPSELPNRDLP